MSEVLKTSTYTIGAGSTIGIESDHRGELKSSQITHPGGFNLRVHYKDSEGTIDITSPAFRVDATSVIDDSSQSGVDGTVAINGIIQP